MNGDRYNHVLSLNIGQEQYIYDDRVKNFDPNLSSAARYSPPPSTSTQDPNVVTPYNIQNHVNAIVTTSEASGVTYNNIIFLPTTSSNGLGQVVDAIELVKNEAEANTNDDTHSYKYIVSSDQRFLNTLIQTNDIDGTHQAINDPANTPLERTSSNMITDNNLILNDVCSTRSNIQQMNLENHQLAVQMQSDYSHNHGTEILMQAPDGQLYRPVQNIFLDNGEANGGEMIPAIVSEHVTFTGIEFTQPNQFDPNTMHHDSPDHVNYEMPNNFIATNQVLDNTVSYTDFKSRKGNEDAVNQFPIDHGYIMENNQMIKPQYQQCLPQVDKDQQRILLESTMSPLLAAVNDITAREKQFQSYLTQNKAEKDNPINVTYYSSSRAQNTKPQISEQYTTSKNPLDLMTVGTKAETATSDPPANEFVDYSEVKFIENKNEAQKNIVPKRKIRRKTTKKRDDELSVADRFVPSRALATLPTTHLYFELRTNDIGSQTQRVVFAKREIPARTKFGPFEGDVKTFTKDEMNKYRKSKSDYPLLFLGQKSSLDVSNENTSNWMRFVKIAKSHHEQNLLLFETDSKLFFKACKAISPKQELHVGYSKEYAEKYNLHQLVPETAAEEKKSNDWHCSKCKKQFPTIDLLQSHLEYHKWNVTPPKRLQISPIRSSTSKSSESGSPIKSKHRLNTGAIRLRKLAQNSRTSGPTVRYACCYCSKVFTKFLSYKKHTNAVHSVDIENKRFTVDAEHKRLTIEDSSTSKGDDVKVSKHRENIENVPANRETDQKWFVCQICQVSFDSAELLEKHRKTKCIKRESLSAQCDVCSKDFQNPAALIMHMKTHDDEVEIFRCIFCFESFKKTRLMKEHVKIHMENGKYSCPHCAKVLTEYASIRKHIRTLHSTVRFRCHECGKDFKSKYKLKEHSLSHSDIRQFLCADCGRQFKRKDKLREHILRLHANTSSSKKNHATSFQPSQTDSTTDRNSSFGSELSSSTDNQASVVKSESVGRGRFQPKVPPTEYHRFIYKCHDYMLGFKRRGMLVNHMAKVHPFVRIDSVHELSLPILKTERCYYCLYCEKVYKSSTKRKAHILKYHPGHALPHSTRGQNEYENTQVPNPSFSQSVGSITTRAHQCDWCHKQYASRNRLLQHQRDSHKTETQDTHTDNGNEYFRDHNFLTDQNPYQTFDMQNRMIEPHHSVNGFGHPEPENKLLRLSSAALEASIRDDLYFLDANDDLKITSSSEVGHSTLPKVDVNFKVGDEFVDASTHPHCELHPLPQLFEGLDCMSLRSSHFNSTNEHNSSGDSIGKVVFPS